MILVVSTGVNGDDFPLGAGRYLWIRLQTVAPLYPKNLTVTNHEKLEKHQ